MGALAGLDFRVFGRVQGVFFRKHAAAEAGSLGLSGWVANRPDGSVAGYAEGPPAAIATYRHWLQFTGSPRCTIERAEFAERTLEAPTVAAGAGFEVRR
jgi:acylphosphatase